MSSLLFKIRVAPAVDLVVDVDPGLRFELHGELLLVRDLIHFWLAVTVSVMS